MDVHSSLFACLFIGLSILIKNSVAFRPITDLVLRYFCGVVQAPIGLEDPLRFSPWMVVVTTSSADGKDSVVNCDATLVSGKHAITSNNCLRKSNTKSLNVIVGAPNLMELSKGVERKVNKINVLVSDYRIAVLQFNFVIFNDKITPVCLKKEPTAGIYATVGWNAVDYKKTLKGKSPENGKKIAYLNMQTCCRSNEHCTEVLPVEEPYEMEAREIQEGAPLLVQKDTNWFLIGIKVEKEIEEQGEIDENNNEKEEDIGVDKHETNEGNKNEDIRKIYLIIHEPEQKTDEEKKRENSEDKDAHKKTEINESGKKPIADDVENVGDVENSMEFARNCAKTTKNENSLFFANMSSEVIDELLAMFGVFA